MSSGLELYPHNEKAYRKLLDMLSGTRRACIIHPTGTGKAFIAYRYAFDHPNERILWMSPSTYIEQEQEASIRRELPNHEFKNIERIAKEESAGRRAELLADFNELRDCASRAANLPAIFQKYFEGIEKVIVFCPNVFELNEIEKMCPRWFSRVNGNVHTYVVHSSNPFGTSEYDGFKEDDDETAIKLLLCVNQLNEGVHIKGVDAVIMVRRTSSPTIFYQQLGRALTAAGNFEPLVIDLVDNFEMIGIEQIVNMMSESYARLSDENDPEELIPPSAFKVIDHEKDARHLAKNLERRLALRSEKLTIDEKIALWKGL